MRECNISTVPAATVAPLQAKKEPMQTATAKGMNTLFGAAKPKTEKTSPIAVDSKVKEEKVSPKQTSPKKRENAPKATKSTASKSISSFFSQPTATTSKSAKPELTVKPEKVEVKKEASMEKSVAKKRMLSNSGDEDKDGGDKDEVPGTPQKQRKKVKMEPKRAKKSDGGKTRSRIMQICDSSSDEETAQATVNVENGRSQETVQKEKENKTPPTVNGESVADKVDRTIDVNTSAPKTRRKVKKRVTKTFEDDEGYISNSI